MKISNIVAEGDVVQFPKKHRGDISDMHECPKCGGDLQGGKYMGHEVKVCMPCKQVYLPPNSGIDQKGNPIKEAGFDYTAKDLGNDYAGFPSNHGLKHKFLARIKPEKQQLYKDKMNNMREFDQLFQLFKVAKARGDIIEQGVAEGSDERKQNALWAQITAHEKAAKKSKDLKQQHHLKMADQLRSQLKTSDNEQGVTEGLNDTIYPNAEVIKTKRGKPVGEIYQDASGWGCHHYDADLGADCIESKEEAIEWLKDIAEEYRQDRSLREQGVAEAPGAETLGHNQSTVASNLNSLDLGEGKPEKPEQPEADYGDDYQAMVSRVKKLAGLGPLKTVYDPNKRVYKNVPTAVQPKK